MAKERRVAPPHDIEFKILSVPIEGTNPKMETGRLIFGNLQPNANLLGDAHGGNSFSIHTAA